jgi:acyl dehydratase
MALDHSLIGKRSEPFQHVYEARDTMLYALGVGAKKSELDYLYEGRGPKVLPSFAVVPMFEPMFKQLSQTGADLSMVVHGAQTVRIHKPFAPSGKVMTTSVLRGIYDMRKWATLVYDMETVDESGAKVAENCAQIIVRDAGGFGGSPAPKDENPAPKPKDKERQPDFVIEEQTSPEQALLYRLSGDRNPLHADPEFAEKVGFAQGPILHGLCTFGYMVRHAAQGMAGGDPGKLGGFCAPFRRPVWPGDTIVTKGYKVTDKAFALEVSVKERPEAVIIGGWAVLA